MWGFFLGQRNVLKLTIMIDTQQYEYTESCWIIHLKKLPSEFLSALVWFSLISMVRASTVFKLLALSPFILLPVLGDSRTGPLQVSPTGLALCFLLVMPCLPPSACHTVSSKARRKHLLLHRFPPQFQCEFCSIFSVFRKAEGKPCLFHLLIPQAMSI